MGGKGNKSKKKKNRSHVLTQKDKEKNELGTKSSCENDSISTSSESESSMEIIPETPLFSQTQNDANQDSSNMNANQPNPNHLESASGSSNESGIPPNLPALNFPSAEFFYHSQSQIESSIYNFNSSFPPLPSQSPINASATPPSTLYSGTQDFLRRENQSRSPKSIKRVLNTSSNSLFNEDESSEFIGFQRSKKNKPGNSDNEQFMDDDDTFSSLHLQLSSDQNKEKHTGPTRNPPIFEPTRTAQQIQISEPSTSRNNIQSNSGMNNKGIAIIIQPSESCRINFFSSTVKLYRILQSSPFHKARIIQSRTNIHRGIQTVNIEDETMVEELIQITNLGDFEVKCFRETNQKYKVGLIGPIEMDITEVEIADLLTDLGYKSPKAERLIIGRGLTQRTTKTMKIWLSVEKLPEKINLFYRRFSVTPYVDKPWQCFKCQGYGHYANSCPNRDRCVVCAANHNVKDCPVRESENRKCVNCGGNHTANYGGCKTMMQEKKVQQVRAFQNISYRDAVKTLKNETRVLTETRTDEQTIPSKRIENKDIPSKNVREISTQTNYETDANNNDETIKSKEKNKNLNENLAYCLLDLFMSMLKADPITKKCALISKAFSDHLGVTVTKEELLCSIRGSTSNYRPTPSPIIQTKPQPNRKNVSKT